MKRTKWLLVPALLLASSACQRKSHQDEIHQAPEPAQAPAAGAPQGGMAAPAGGGEAMPAPISSRGGGMAAPAPGPGSAGLGYQLPPRWQAVAPSSSMRIAQAAIPGPGGTADLAVFFFGPGGGGSVEANFERWAGQVEGAGAPTRDSFEANGLKVSWIEVIGTVKPSQTGMGPATEQPGSRLLGAVVEGPGGPWFFKAVGPDTTLAVERENFFALLKSVHRQ